VKIAVIAHPETAQGFLLAGLEAYGASTPEEAKARLAELVQSKDYALVAVDGSLLPDPEKAVEKLMRGRDLPVPPVHRGAKGGLPEPRRGGLHARLGARDHRL
jgi:V/A-type H+-transporting ATPase subunit F